MNVHDKTLIEAAQNRFADLSQAEKRLLEWGVLGVAANRAFDDGTETDQLLTRESEWGCWDSWKADRSVRADLLRWLCTDKTVVDKVDPKGIRVDHALVTGVLDLSHASVTFPIKCGFCAFPDGIEAREANLASINLGGSHISHCDFTGTVINGGMTLAEGAVVLRGLLMPGSRVNLSLTLSGSKLCGDPYGLAADGIHVGYAIYLGIHAEAYIRLVHSEIAGDLSLVGATIIGQVALSNSKIHGNVHIYNAVLENHDGEDVVDASGTEIDGDVIIGGGLGKSPEEGLHSTGCISFRSCHIGRNFRVGSASLNPNYPYGVALSLERAQVTSSLMIREGCRLKGALDLRHAAVDVLDDRTDSWPPATQLGVTGLTYRSIAPQAPTRWKERLRWLKLQPRGTFTPQPYVCLATVLKQMGYEKDGRRILLAAARSQWWHERPRRPWHVGRFLEFLWRLMLELMLGHGYRVSQSVILIVSLWLVGSQLFLFGYREHVMIPVVSNASKAESRGSNEPFATNYRHFDPWIYSLDVLLPVPDFKQEAYWRPDACKGRLVWGETLGVWLLRYTWLHISLGWMLTTFFLVGLSGLVRLEKR